MLYNFEIINYRNNDKNATWLRAPWKTHKLNAKPKTDTQ